MASLVNCQTVMEQLLDCAVAELTDPPSRAFTTTGEVVWDCEQVWVRAISVIPNYAVSREKTPTITPCGPISWSVNLGVGVIRCVAGMNDQGVPPSGAQTMADGAEAVADMLALLRGLACCDIDEPQRLGAWNAQGPEGGFSGGEWELTLVFTN